MENNKFSWEIEEEKRNEAEKQKVTAGRVVHLTAAIVLLIVATVAVIFTVSFGVRFFTLRAEQAGLTDAGEQLGSGIAQVFLVVFMLVGAVVGGILSIISLVLSITVWRYRLGRERVYGIVSTVLNALYIIVCAAAPIMLSIL